MDHSDISLHPGKIELTIEMANHAGICSGDKVLDIGCGTGRSLAALNDRFKIIPYGIDSSESVLSVTKKNHPDLELCCCDASSLPFSDSYFDVVMLECVLTLLDDPGSALKEAVRVLKPGGKLMISTLSQPVSEPGLQVPTLQESPLVKCGLIVPHVLLRYTEAFGLALVSSEDRKKELTDYMIETIMEYGSLEERISAETASTGASVFDCSLNYDPANITYYSFVFQKTYQQQGTEQTLL